MVDALVQLIIVETKSGKQLGSIEGLKPKFVSVLGAPPLHSVKNKVRLLSQEVQSRGSDSLQDVKEHPLRKSVEVLTEVTTREVSGWSFELQHIRVEIPMWHLFPSEVSLCASCIMHSYLWLNVDG